MDVVGVLIAAEEPTVEGVNTTTAVLLALASTALLATLHLLAPRIRKLPAVPERATASFAGGLAVAYVFLHLLPELATGDSELAEVLGDEAGPTPLTELGIFLVALVGFTLFYGLERLAQRRHPARDPDPRGATPEAAAGRGHRSSDVRVFWVHLTSFAAYNAVITYTLPSTYRTGVAFAVLFTIAMGLHFVLSDRGLEEDYGALFDRRAPRLLLAGALVLGWVLATLFAPTRALTVSLLTAFLAGSVLLNVFKEELPPARQSSLPWFLIGLGLYAALLITITTLGASD